MVGDPAAMLQCFRASLGGSIRNVAWLLLYNGIPFNTFCRHPPTCTKRLHMQYICSPIIISLTPTTTHNTKKFVIEFSLGLTNGPLSLRVVLCGDLCCTLFNIQQTQSTSSLRALQRMLSLKDVS